MVTDKSQEGTNRKQGLFAPFQMALAGRLPLRIAYWVIGIVPLLLGFFAQVTREVAPLAIVLVILWLASSIAWAIGVRRCARRAEPGTWVTLAKLSANLSLFFVGLVGLAAIVSLVAAALGITK